MPEPFKSYEPRNETELALVTFCGARATEGADIEEMLHGLENIAAHMRQAKGSAVSAV